MLRLRLWSLTIGFLVAGCGCGARRSELTESEKALGLSAGVDERVLLQLRAFGTGLRRLNGIDESENPMPLPGVVMSVQTGGTDTALERLRGSISSEYFVFISGIQPGLFGSRQDIACVRNMSPWDVLIAMRTDGANYDITTEVLIARLRQWDALYGLDFREIERDSLRAEFRRKPADMLAFAREVYVFCPDVVTQGAGSVEKLASEMDKSNSVYLWWD